MRERKGKQMLKSRIFIASSSESYEIAKEVKKYMESEYECVTWKDENFFKQNQSTYDNLLKESVGFDFAIFIGGADDFVRRSKDGSVKMAPRDNVYLEFGLYAGVLTKYRTFFLLQANAKIASDLSGITIEWYKDVQDIPKCCETIKKEIEREEKINRIQLLPSTSLAVGYYSNFLEPLGEKIYRLKSVTVDGNDYQVEKCTLEIIIPKATQTDWAKWAKEYYWNHGCEEIQLDGGVGTLNVMIDFKALVEKKELRMLNIPLTLRASFKAVDLVMQKDYIGITSRQEIARNREINNFIKTLENIISSDPHMESRTTFVTI